MIKIVLMLYSVVALLIVGSFCKPPLDDKKDRVVEKVLKEAEHFGSEHHSKDYDHEAFLGEDAKEFDQLTPQESTRRLSIIVDKIDKNKDGLVSFEELREWIQYTQNKYLANDIDAQWKTHNPDKNDTLDWSQYRKSVYGIVNDLEVEDLDRQNANEGFSYKKLLSRDRRRWDAADINADGVLNKEEFAAFLHPEEMSHMRDLVVYETLEDIDKDGDKKISVDEYIGDMYQANYDDEEPSWVRSEREQFKLYRDKDKDGYMDMEEVKEWILPIGFNHAEAEARHLIYESDSNADQKLTKDEILAKYDLFVGSQATDFGEALARHDEF